MASTADFRTFGPRTAIILVHGTFATDATWIEPDSPLCKALLAADLGATPDTIHAFRWSGDNFAASRQEAANELRMFVERLCATSNHTHLFVIAHSHGGNVALYTSAYATAHAAIDGIACLATPFLHAHKRQLNHGTVDFLKISLSMMLAVMFAQGVIQIGYELDYRHVWGAVVGFLGVYLGSKFGIALEHELGAADRTVEEVEARVWGACNLKIIRVTGDEASFSLAAGQLVSWVSARLYGKVASAPPAKWPYLRFRNHPLGRTAWVLAAIAALALAAFFLFPIRSTALPSAALTALWLYLLYQKTNILDYVAAGLLSIGLGLALAVHSAAVGLGRVEPYWSVGTSRFLFRVARAFAVEVHTEAVPPGTWSLTQLPRPDVVPEAYRAELTHSIYNDARVHAELVDWLAASLRQPGRRAQPPQGGSIRIGTDPRASGPLSIEDTATGRFVTPERSGPSG